MKQRRCIVYGYISEGQDPLETCPQCKTPASKFEEVKEDDNIVWAAEHQVGIAKDVDEEIKAGLRANFEGECSKVGIYLAMSRAVFREGHPEIGEYWRRATFEEADHTSCFVGMLGEVVTSSTKKNLEMRVATGFGATQGKVNLATLAKRQNLDAIHSSVYEMACDEARHGRALQGLLKRYLGEEK